MKKQSSDSVKRLVRKYYQKNNILDPIEKPDNLRFSLRYVTEILLSYIVDYRLSKIAKPENFEVCLFVFVSNSAIYGGKIEH